MKIFKTIVVTLAFAALAMSASSGDCWLAKKMLSLGVETSDVEQLLCLTAETVESGKYYGIFQMSETWCGGDPSTNPCGESCADIGADLNAAIRCAKRAFKKDGWSAWPHLKACSISIANCTLV